MPNRLALCTPGRSAASMHRLDRQLLRLQRLAATIAAFVAIGALAAVLVLPGPHSGEVGCHRPPPAPGTKPRRDAVHQQLSPQDSLRPPQASSAT